MALFVTLTGCGGGGTEALTTVTSPETQTPTPNPTPTPTPTPEVLTGTFVDSAVAGLKFETATQMGTTDARGYFSYVAGEDVTFSIGGITFPAVPAKETLSPLDIFGTTETSDVRVINMARLLQTLDQDGMPGNGITITDNAHNQATGVTVDFSAANFAEQVQDVIANSGAVITTLINSTDAINHLNITLGNMEAMSSSCSENNLKAGYTGTFSTLAYEVAGKVTVLDNCTLEITMFNYVDGGAPAVQIYAGVAGVFTGADAFGFGPRFEGRTLRNETLIINLPAGKTVADFDSLSVWCFDFDADFGSLRLEAP